MSPKRLPPDDDDLLYALLERFQKQWQSGGRPEISEFLAGASGELRRQLLEGLLEIDLKWRQRNGEVRPREHYLGQFPECRDLIERLVVGASADAARPEEATQAVTGSGAAPLPESIGRYKVIEEIGEGAASVVYKATDPSLSRPPLAIKVLKGGLAAGAAEIGRFRKEAEIVSQLDHPHIVRMFDYGERDGAPYLVMQHVDGPTLDGWRKAGKVPALQAAYLVAQAAGAIAYASSKGVIHRDLKPSNILLTADGQQVKITDFGVAKMLESEGGLTRTGQMIGTPEYMAPEQVRGNPGEIGPATDVYGLGGVLYYLLAGRQPFQGMTLNDRVRLGPQTSPPSPRSFDPDIPEVLALICEKCLVAYAHGRYEANDLQADLMLAIDGYLPRAVVGRNIHHHWVAEGGSAPIGEAQRRELGIRRAGCWGCSGWFLICFLSICVFFAHEKNEEDPVTYVGRLNRYLFNAARLSAVFAVSWLGWKSARFDEKDTGEWDSLIPYGERWNRSILGRLYGASVFGCLVPIVLQAVVRLESSLIVGFYIQAIHGVITADSDPWFSTACPFLLPQVSGLWTDVGSYL